MLVYLDGVAAAEGDVGAALAGEVGEDAMGTDGAVWVGGGGGDLAAIEAGGGGRGPEVEGQEGSAEKVGLPGEQLEGFGGLDGGGEVDGHGEDAGGVAGFDGAGGRLGEEAGEAGGGLPGFAGEGAGGLWRGRGWLEGAGEDGHGGGVGADGGGVDPRLALLDGEVVEEVAGFEVVGGVEDEVGGAEETVDVGGDEVGDLRMDADGGVEAMDLAPGGFGLGESVAGVGLVEEDLPLEVGFFDEVAVDEGEGADAGAGEEGGGGGTGGADADDGDVGLAEESLAGDADAGEEDLAGVAGFVGGGVWSFRGLWEPGYGRGGSWRWWGHGSFFSIERVTCDAGVSRGAELAWKMDEAQHSDPQDG